MTFHLESVHAGGSGGNFDWFRTSVIFSTLRDYTSLAASASLLSSVIAFELGSPVTLYYLQKRGDVKAGFCLGLAGRFRPRAAKSSQRERRDVLFILQSKR